MPKSNGVAYLKEKQVPAVVNRALEVVFEYEPSNVRSFLAAYFACPDQTSNPPDKIAADKRNPVRYAHRVGIHSAIDTAVQEVLELKPASVELALSEHFSRDFHRIKARQPPKNKKAASRRWRYKKPARRPEDSVNGAKDEALESAWYDSVATKEPAATDTIDVVLDIITQSPVPLATCAGDVTAEWVAQILRDAGEEIGKIAVAPTPADAAAGVPASPASRKVISKNPSFSFSPHRRNSMPGGGLAHEELFYRRPSSFSPQGLQALTRKFTGSPLRGGAVSPPAGLIAYPSVNLEVEPLAEQGAQSTTLSISMEINPKNGGAKVTRSFILKLCGSDEGWSGSATVAAREMGFYKDVAPILMKSSFLVPKLYWAGCSSAWGNLLLEDVSVGNTRGSTCDDWELILGAVGALHSIFYKLDPHKVPRWRPNYSLSDDLLVESGGKHAVWHFGPFAGAPSWQGPMTKESIGVYRIGLMRLIRWGKLDAACLPAFDKLFDELPNLCAKVSRTKTVCRGDCHLWNAFIRGEKQVIFYDFAEWSDTHPAGEVAYSWYSTWLADKPPREPAEVIDTYYKAVETDAPFSKEQFTYDFRVAAVFTIRLHLEYIMEQWMDLWDVEDPADISQDADFTRFFKEVANPHLPEHLKLLAVAGEPLYLTQMAAAGHWWSFGTQAAAVASLKSNAFGDLPPDEDIPLAQGRWVGAVVIEATTLSSFYASGDLMWYEAIDPLFASSFSLSSSSFCSATDERQEATQRQLEWTPCSNDFSRKLTLAEWEITDVQRAGRRRGSCEHKVFKPVPCSVWGLLRHQIGEPADGDVWDRPLTFYEDLHKVCAMPLVFNS
ncbi:hypothetical protein DIPPA_30509 [Diplonema papillatum]|nr:hypothetical protein DIPPA_30509 [Diplonema papillatum]